VGGDLGVDIGRRQFVEPALFGAAPRFLEPVEWRCHGADEILHAHDDDGGVSDGLSPKRSRYSIEKQPIRANPCAAADPSAADSA
jgi:hypothetical protein